jgi:hypothetical protein
VIGIPVGFHTLLYVNRNKINRSLAVREKDESIKFMRFLFEHCTYPFLGGTQACT